MPGLIKLLDQAVEIELKRVRETTKQCMTELNLEETQYDNLEASDIDVAARKILNKCIKKDRAIPEEREEEKEITEQLV